MVAMSNIFLKTGTTNSNYYCTTFEFFRFLNKEGQLSNLCQTFDNYIDRQEMKMYRQLTYEHSVYIDVLNFQRKCRREIADSLRVNRSTKTREFQRGCSSNGGWGTLLPVRVS